MHNHFTRDQGKCPSGLSWLVLSKFSKEKGGLNPMTTYLLPLSLALNAFFFLFCIFHRFKQNERNEREALYLRRLIQSVNTLKKKMDSTQDPELAQVYKQLESLEPVWLKEVGIDINR